MSEQDRPQNGGARGDADQTLLGVAPPRLESASSPLRSPVFVRSGTSVADVEPPPVPPNALPSPPVRAQAGDSDAAVQLPPSANPASGQWPIARRFLANHPALWMLLAPGLSALFAIGIVRVTVSHHGSPPRRSLTTGGSAAAPSNTAALGNEPNADDLSKLERRPPESLNVRELAVLANAHTEALRASAKALRLKVEANPALGKDPALQSELMRLADDPRTSIDALSAMAVLEAPVGADLLYEVWTRTAVRSDATDLARALVYSTDMRSKASPALSVALELRAAESCEQYKAILPNALKDGDRRAVHLLTKLNGKRGCGPKQTEDCYACLRAQGDELKATINAVKSRRPPDYGAR